MDFTCFLYDAFQLDEERGKKSHGNRFRLYTALDLSSEEEAIMNAAMHHLRWWTKGKPVPLREGRRN